MYYKNEFMALAGVATPDPPGPLRGWVTSPCWSRKKERSEFAPEQVFRGGYDGIRTHDPHALPPSGVRGLVFTVEQLELMLAEARRLQKEAASRA